VCSEAIMVTYSCIIANNITAVAVGFHKHHD